MMKLMTVASLLVGSAVSLVSLQSHAQATAADFSDELIDKAMACAKESNNVPSSSKIGSMSVDSTTIQVYVDMGDHIATIAWIKVLDGQVYEQNLVTGNLRLCKSNTQASVYGNARFGFSFAYPTSLFSAPQEPENGDGATLESLDGHAEVLAYGSYSPIVIPTNLTKLYQGELTTPGRTVTYKVFNSAKNFFVVSGIAGSKIFYTKTYVIGDTEKTLQITYDQSAKSTYDPVVTQISNSFSPN